MLHFGGLCLHYRAFQNPPKYPTTSYDGAALRASALWLGSTALDRLGASPMKISAGTVLLRALMALARICP